MNTELDNNANNNTLVNEMQESINTAFLSFKNQYQTLETVCNEEIMSSFKDFIAFCYISDQGCGDGVEYILEDLRNSNPDFEISTLMRTAMELGERSYNHDKFDLEYMSEDFLDFDKDEDEDRYADEKWEALDEAETIIMNKIKTKTFKELSKVLLNENAIKRDYYENGQLKKEGEWVNDKGVGVHKGWYKNGQLEYECGWQDGVPHGTNNQWYDNGQLKYKCNYIVGNLDGLNSFWNEDGDLLIETEWKDGKELFKPNVLPISYFREKIKIYDQGGDVTNQDTGETYKLNFIELSIYDVILGAQSQMDMMGFSKDSIEISNTGLEWFQETNPEAYKILFQ
ncbi:MAG: hypothetical protein HOA49_06750 [Flavobacteriales bacterium]|nr:hypothetical protein [Flavobacteriales bacterium]